MPEREDQIGPQDQTWEGPIATKGDEGHLNMVLFGKVTVTLQGPPGDVDLAWKALLLLHGKLDGVLTPGSVVGLTVTKRP